MKTLKVSSANHSTVWQSGFANRHASQPRKPLGSVMYLNGLQAQVSVAACPACPDGFGQGVLGGADGAG